MRIERLKRVVVLLAGVALLASACVAPSRTSFIRPDDYTETIRVACVGDSITFGAGIEDRQKNSYPAQLGRMLGKSWQTRNLGVSGATLLKQGDLPYWRQKAFSTALAWRPHIVIIKLGTNDTKPQNWKHKEQFAPDYRAMIERFGALDTKPRIWVCLPVPAFPERWGIRDTVIKGEVIPIVRQVAEETGAQVIDLYTPLEGKPEMFPDKIHPNAAGAGVMAREIYRALTGKPWEKEVVGGAMVR